MEFIVFGVGSPICVTSTCQEGAELYVCEQFGIDVDRLVVLRVTDVMLH